MTKTSLDDLLANEEGSLPQTIEVIKKLRKELQEGRLDDGENASLEAFLEAMQAWLESVGPKMQRPSWKFIEALLRAAKAYE